MPGRMSPGFTTRRAATQHEALHQRRTGRTLTAGVPAAQYNSGMNVSIGARADGTTRWNGKIDEVRLYARA